MLDFLADLEVPVIIAVTKVDKLSPPQAARRMEELARSLGMDMDQLIPFSSHTGQGRDELAAAIEQLVEDAERERAEREQAEREQAEREQAEQEQAKTEQAERESAAATGAEAADAAESRDGSPDPRP